MAPAPSSPVLLRLPRPDHAADEADFVLLHVTPANADPRRPLDVKLIGTENTTVFAVSLEHEHTSSSKDPKSKISQEQWDAILSSVLLGSHPDEEYAALIQGIEAVAKLESRGTKLTITIQRHVEGITQRFGAITLRATEDEEIDTFEWCASAVASKDRTIEELERLKSAAGEKDEKIKKLEDALAELVELKNGHEKALLEKFSLLLNEKKLKIRDQQRLLASSTVDPAKLQALEETRREPSSRSAGPSRKGKRKAVAAAAVSEDSDDGFEGMDIDKVDEEPSMDSEVEDRRTPEPDEEDETASENDDSPPPSTRKPAEEPSTGRSSMRRTVSPPRKRDLPSRAAPPPRKPEATLEGSETESDDDEL